ncbi:hypothetical protein [Streptomyces turgidiscabies]|uniref:hypothetical protein n=1 Tax=Streptomyces turgidiscabies TaxID=85558 RepID=UPI0027D7C007|nr:hypothetical protein [Streptomyces turgidiscabies]
MPRYIEFRDSLPHTASGKIAKAELHAEPHSERVVDLRASCHPAVKAAVPQVTGIDMGAGHVGAQWSQQVPYLAGLNDLLQIWTDNDGYLAEIDWSADSVENIVAAARAGIGECRAATQLLERSVDQGWYNRTATATPTTRRPFRSCTGRTGTTRASFPSDCATGGISAR